MKSKLTAPLAQSVWILFALIGMGAVSFAFTPGACKQDAAKLCPGLKGKELTPCLKQHMEELSMPCKVNLAEGRELVREAKDACQPDTEKFCKDVPPGQGRIRRCLKEHEAELTAECKASIGAIRKRIEAGAAAPDNINISTGTPLK